jgi:hypothetical protein
LRGRETSEGANREKSVHTQVEAGMSTRRDLPPQAGIEWPVMQMIGKRWNT